MVKKILIIDDEPSHRLIYRTQIEQFMLPPVEVVEASNKDDGLRMIVTEQPDAVVLDHQMAGGTGLELLNDLRKALKGHAPIILLSCNMNEALKRNAMALGAVACMEKSTMTKGDLVDTINEVME